MKDAVTFVALGLAIACFLLYATFVILLIPAAKQAARAAKGIQPGQSGQQPNLIAPSPADIGKLADSLTALVTALNNAGPALIAILGSVFFLLIAAANTDAFKQSPPAPPANSDSHCITAPPANSPGGNTTPQTQTPGGNTPPQAQSPGGSAPTSAQPSPQPTPQPIPQRTAALPCPK